MKKIFIIGTSPRTKEEENKPPFDGFPKRLLAYWMNIPLDELDKRFEFEYLVKKYPGRYKNNLSFPHSKAKHNAKFHFDLSKRNVIFVEWFVMDSFGESTANMFEWKKSKCGKYKFSVIPRLSRGTTVWKNKRVIPKIRKFFNELP